MEHFFLCEYVVLFWQFFQCCYKLLYDMSTYHRSYDGWNAAFENVVHAFAPLHSFIFSFSVPWRGNSGLFSGFGFWKDLLQRVDICAHLQIIRRIHSNNAKCNLRIHRLEIYIINLIIKLVKMHFKHNLFLNDIK